MYVLHKRRFGEGAALRLFISFAVGLVASTAYAAPRQTQLDLARGSIQHVIIIMQENRSFDSYFGTFKGARGFLPGTCVPLNPAKPALGCVKPYHDFHDQNGAARHYAPDAQAVIDDGITTVKMDGFNQVQATSNFGCADYTPQNCVAVSQGVLRHDVMGFHNADEIPNYWSYAQHFVLQDRLFEGVRSWSWPAHVELTSEWTALCSNTADAESCTTNNMPLFEPPSASGELLSIPWVNLFQLLDRHNVSWKYYVASGNEPDCPDDEMSCAPHAQSASRPSIWNPVSYFKSVQLAGPAYLARHNPPTTQFIADIQAGALPQVSWLIPDADTSEHPPSSVTTGMEYVTTLVNAVMNSPYWANTAIFITWDDWGGFYDHLAPPNIDSGDTVDPIEGYGLRVPGLLISPYANAGTIDDSVLSFDSYASLVEDLFTNGARLDPVALGQPDQRPTIRDKVKSVRFVGGRIEAAGNLLNEFNFSQAPLPKLILSTAIPTNLTANCAVSTTTFQCTAATITLSWSAIASTAGTPPFLYHVTRDNMAFPGNSTAATRCVDTAPPSGNHLYRIYSTDSAGVVSPLSAAIEVDVP